MKITSNTNINKNITFSGFYNNKYLLKGLKFASKNGALFSATTTVVLSSIARPISIMVTPKADKENKKHALAKSISSTVVGYLIMLSASLPVANAIDKIDKNPEIYLTKETIRNLQNKAPSLSKSKSYLLATQIFKLGLGLAIAVPKSTITNYLIAPILKLMPQKKDVEKNVSKRKNSSIISFKSSVFKIENLSKAFGSILNLKPLQDFAKKYCDSNFAQHVMSLTDVLLTATVVNKIKNNKKIDEKRKKPLIHNSVISTALCLASGYTINNLLNKPMDKFIQKFCAVNKDLPELERYLDGLKVVKPTLILGIIYYIFIPMFATFFADKTSQNNSRKI